MSFTAFELNDRVLNTRMNQFGNEMLSQITKYSTYDLYLKAGNLMNTQKPTGAGSLVTFANVTEVSQLAFTFNYAIPERLIISSDNKYNLVMPFQGLESNRSYIFRYVYKHEGTTIFDITRNAVSTATGNFTVEFQALNQNTADIIAEANTTVSLQIYVRTVAGTDTQIAMLVNDVNALGRLSRNEATASIQVFESSAFVMLNSWNLLADSYIKRSGNVVNLQLRMSRADEVTLQDITDISSLFAGVFKPDKNVEFTSYIEGVGYSGDGFISSTGMITFVNNPVSVANKNVVVRMSYVL